MKIIQHTDDTLIIEEKPWLAAVVMGGFALLFLVLGILMLVDLLAGGFILLAISGAIFLAVYRLVEHFQLIFSRPDQTVEFHNKSLYQDKWKKYPLSEINGSYVVEKHSTSTNGTTTKMSRITLTRTNGSEQLPVTNSYTSGEQYQQISEVINAWLEHD